MNPNFERIIRSPEQSFTYHLWSHSNIPFRWHHHNEYELTAVCQGNGTRFIGDSIRNYNGTDLILVGPNLPHTLLSKGICKPMANKTCVIQFDRNFLGGAVWDCPEFRIIKTLLEKSSAGICFHGKERDKIIKKMIMMDKQTNLQKLISLIDILEQLGRWKNSEILSLKVFNKSINSKQVNRIDKVLRYISQHYSQEISLTQAAKIVHMSSSNLSRFFRRATGKNFINYVNEFRISIACDLLIETDMNIAEICFVSGFQGIANFNRQFKKFKKTSPKYFRKQFLKHNPKM